MVFWGLNFFRVNPRDLWDLQLNPGMFWQSWVYGTPLVSAISVRKQPVYRHLPMNQLQTPVDCELAGLDFRAISEFFWLKLNQSCL